MLHHLCCQLCLSLSTPREETVAIIITYFLVSRANNGLGEQKPQCSASLSLVRRDGSGNAQWLAFTPRVPRCRNWSEREQISSWKRIRLRGWEPVRLSWHPVDQLGQAAVRKHHRRLPSGHFKSFRSTHACASDGIFEIEFSDLLLQFFLTPQRRFLLLKPQIETISILHEIASLIKESK